jgi:hypothetical protein
MLRYVIRNSVCGVGNYPAFSEAYEAYKSECKNYGIKVKDEIFQDCEVVIYEYSTSTGETIFEEERVYTPKDFKSLKNFNIE